MAASGGASGSFSSSLHCCEVCGKSELTDDMLWHHLKHEHIQDCSVCPFCDMVDVSAEVMMIHVNEVHLEYLSPQSEMIDDSELFEDCMDTTTAADVISSTHSHNKSGGSFPTFSSIVKRDSSSQSKLSVRGSVAAKATRDSGAQTETASCVPGSNASIQVMGGGAVSKRAPLMDTSNSLHGTRNKNRSCRDRHHTDGSRDSVQRLTRSASNSPAYSRRIVSNLNEVKASDVSVDDNCNPHASPSAARVADNRCTSSSPSRSHLSLSLNTKHATDSVSVSQAACFRRGVFASGRSNSTPVAISSSTGKRCPPVESLKDDGDITDAVTNCPICGQEETNPQQMERHINQAHFDTTSPTLLEADGVTVLATTGLLCPLCEAAFETVQDLELHVNVEHRDVLSPDQPNSSVKPALDGYSLAARGGAAVTSNPGSECSNTGSSDDDADKCLVCGRAGFCDNLSLAEHIETHFNRMPSSVSPEPNTKEPLLPSQERREQDLRRMREKQEFSKLQAQYGMDGYGSFKQQYVTSLQRAVYSGHITIADYYERKIQLNKAECTGLDDGRTRTKGILAGVQALSQRCRQVRQLHLCSAVDHYGSTCGDRGWGCGYRNIQMLLCALQHNTSYYQRLFAAPDTIPSIAALQGMIERAWGAGFDVQGCEQLGGKLTNTRKWIGATEVTTLLSFFRIRCELLDFHLPSGAGGTHPDLFQWCLRYFSSTADFKPPLYLQHQGHSRTIIGCEVLSSGGGEDGDAGAVQLLVLDPSHSTGQLMRLVQARYDGGDPDQQQQQQQQQENVNHERSNGGNNNNRGGGAGKKVGYTLAGEKVVVDCEDTWKSGGGRGMNGARGGGRGRGGGGGTNYNNSTGGVGPLRLLRRPLRTMKAQQYQLVAVTGVIDTEEQYQRSKVLHSTRIPES